jgi:4-amino-4-deoxy-L-arabinose transferase-like glycosyltransferase
MATSPASMNPARTPGPMGWLWLLLGVVLIVRVVGLVATPLELGPDEAQYWQWSRSLEFGYYSKPPLVAWTIWFTTALFGNDEWAVRLGAPFAHTATAAILALLAARVAGPVAGAWAGALWITMPVVWLGASIITTDTVLLPFWALALYALARALEARDAGQNRAILVWCLVMGTAIGIGALAKYAALYFLAGLAAGVVLSARVRALIVGPGGLVAALGVLAALGPNLLWNAANGFMTVGHTVDNANIGARMGLLPETLEFLGSQFALVGPLALTGSVWVLVSWRRRFDPSDARADLRVVLLALATIPIIVISIQAFISRANANWAATAFPAIVVLTAWGLSALRPGRLLLAAALGLQLVVGAAFTALTVSPQLVDGVGLANAVKRARGWEATAAAVRARLADGTHTAVLVDSRLVYHQLIYYGRAQPWPVPITVWRRFSEPQSHAEKIAPLTDDIAGRVLVVSLAQDPSEVLADFGAHVAQAPIVIRLDPDRTRTFSVSSATRWDPLPKPQRRLQPSDDPDA